MSRKDILEAAKKYADEHAPQLSGAGRGQMMMNRIITVVTIAVVGLVGVLIFDEVLTSLGDPSGTNAENRTNLENATVEVVGGFEGAMQLVPVVLIILLAAVVIGIVSRLR